MRQKCMNKSDATRYRDTGGYGIILKLCTESLVKVYSLCKNGHDYRTQSTAKKNLSLFTLSLEKFMYLSMSVIIIRLVFLKAAWIYKQTSVHTVPAPPTSCSPSHLMQPRLLLPCSPAPLPNKLNPSSSYLFLFSVLPSLFHSFLIVLFFQHFFFLLDIIFFFLPLNHLEIPPFPHFLLDILQDSCLTLHIFISFYFLTFLTS